MTWPSPPGEEQLAAARRKIEGGLASSERALLALPEYAAAVAARVALECARAEGARLFTSAPAVDQAAVDALAKSAAEAAGKLHALEQGTREVAKLQLFASASATLHKELQAFLDLAARLKATRPRAVALEGAPPPVEAQPAPPPAPPPPARIRLADFAAFRQSPSARRKLIALWALVALFLAAAVRAAFFSGPSVEQIEAAAPDVGQVRISGDAAAVSVQKGWTPAQLPQLLEALRARGVTTAAIAGVGQVDVKSGKLYGARTAAPPSSAPGSR